MIMGFLFLNLFLTMLVPASALIVTKQRQKNEVIKEDIISTSNFDSRLFGYVYHSNGSIAKNVQVYIYNADLADNNNNPSKAFTNDEGYYYSDERSQCGYIAYAYDSTTYEEINGEKWGLQSDINYFRISYGLEEYRLDFVLKYKKIEKTCSKNIKAKEVTEQLIDNQKPVMELFYGPEDIVIDRPAPFTLLANDPDGDDLYYIIDWGDGEDETTYGPYNSGEEVEIFKTFSSPQGFYILFAKAMDTNNAISEKMQFKAKVAKEKTKLIPFYLIIEKIFGINIFQNI